MTRFAAMTLTGLLLPFAAPAAAQQVAPACTDGSRACLARTVGIYLDGLARNDATAIPFAARVRCTEQGNVAAKDEAEFRRELTIYKVEMHIRNVRWLIDERAGSVAVFYLLDIGTFRGDPPFTVRRGQRFHIDNGLITEVEVLNFFDRQGGKLAEPLWPETGPVPPAAKIAIAHANDGAPLCTAATPKCYRTTARAYFDAILAGKADRVPFAGNVRVTEQDRLVATSRAAFLKEFVSTGATKKLRNMRMLVDTDSGQVAVMVLSDVEMPGQAPFTVRRIQRLKIERGLISQVELVVFSDPKPDALWPDESIR